MPQLRKRSQIIANQRRDFVLELLEPRLMMAGDWQVSEPTLLNESSPAAGEEMNQNAKCNWHSY